MNLKLSDQRYKYKGTIYQEVHIGYPVTVFDTDLFAMVSGTMVFDGETITVVPDYIFNNFTKLGD